MLQQSSRVPEIAWPGHENILVPVQHLNIQKLTFIVIIILKKNLN